MRMKKKMILFTVITLLIMIVGMGCEIETPKDCYSGTIVSLNESRNGCNNIVRIDKALENGIPTGTTLAFNASVFDKKLKLGETIYFKVINYERWVGPATADCLWPYYMARIDVCNH